MLKENHIEMYIQHSTLNHIQHTMKENLLLLKDLLEL